MARSGLGDRRRRGWLMAARAVLAAERMVAAFWPAACVLAGLAALALFGLFSALPFWPHVGLVCAALAGVAAAITAGFRGFTWPTTEAAERRLERDSGLRHRPLAVLRDRPGGEAADALAVWQVHRARAAAALQHLRLARPDAQLERHDTMALRSAALLVLAAGLAVAGPDAPARLYAALIPAPQAGAAGTAAMLQAWIEPPAYTGMAPLLLPAGGGEAQVPAGSKLTVSVTGLWLAPSVSIAGETAAVSSLGQSSWQAVATLQHSGRLSIHRLFHEVGGWNVTVLPNDPPVVAWDGAPGEAGRSLATRLPWRASQRWGVASLEAELRPTLHDGAGHPARDPRRLRLPLPGTPREAHGAPIQDLSEDPYAGLKMTARLTVTDVSGQHGASDAVEFTLPARVFRNPLARAIADLRRRMALDPSAREDASGDLEAMADARDSYGGKTGVYLNLVSVAALLMEDRSAEAFGEAEGRLWTLALALDGALPDASTRALAQARDKLRRLLDDRSHGRLDNGELAQRLQALREALAQRLQDLARKAMRQGAVQPFDPHAKKFSSSLLDRMIQKIEQAARAGQAEEAKRLMAELERRLDQLQAAKVLTGEQAAQAARQAREGRQQLGAVQDLVKREGRLMDQAQSREPESMQKPGTPSPDSARDARTQRALSRALEALKQGFQALGGKVPSSLDDARQAMKDAEGGLAAGDDRSAREAMGRAIQSLQQGGQEMARQMRGNSSILSLQPDDGGQAGEQAGDEDGDDGTQPGGGEDGQGQDPLGRQRNGTGGKLADDPDLKVPDQMEQGRSRAIQEELRRRGADRERRQEELDYIDRLLKPF